MIQITEISTPAAIFFGVMVVALLIVIYKKDKRYEDMKRHFAGYLEQLDKENWKLKIGK